MPPEVAATVKRALTGLSATAPRGGSVGTYVAANGTPLAVGGKTGTGDNRFERYWPSGGDSSPREWSTAPRPLSSSSATAFSAQVTGPDVALHFTSAIACNCRRRSARARTADQCPAAIAAWRLLPAYAGNAAAGR
jgi:hypothetical protein